MTIVLIVIAIAVYHFGSKLMSYVNQQKEKYTAVSLQGVTLSAVSVILSASFMTFFILLLPYLFITHELTPKYAFTIFSTVLALMIGIEVTSESPPDFPHHAKAAIFLILLGVIFWPVTYLTAQSIVTTFTSVVLFDEADIIQFSASMIAMTLACPIIIELTERYI